MLNNCGIKDCDVCPFDGCILNGNGKIDRLGYDEFIDFDYPEQLQQIRSELGISRRVLAELSGTNQYAIHHIESRLHRPKIETLQTLLNVMGYELKIVKKGENG